MSNQIDRALEILLLLRSGKTLSAATLAERFEVSTRTIYRDIETLSAAGVPVYAAMGRDGGFRLLEGYFLPPVMFTENEAASLLIGLTLLRRLRVAPFPAAIATAEQKLLAALPEQLAAHLAQAPQLIGFERIPPDLFLLKWQPDQPKPEPKAVEATLAHESEMVGTFLRALFAGHQVALTYHSPYSGQTRQYSVQPSGLLWDRDWWYLVGQRVVAAPVPEKPDETAQEPWLWRADRVLSIATGPPVSRQSATPVTAAFTINDLLGRTWLANAMQKWRGEAPVQVRITAQQAAILRQDWYYRYADYSERADGDWLMTFGEDNPQLVLDLLRWLGPGAELLKPQAWRADLYEELLRMAALYAEPTAPSPP